MTEMFYAILGFIARFAAAMVVLLVIDIVDDGAYEKGYRDEGIRLGRKQAYDRIANAIEAARRGDERE